MKFELEDFLKAYNISEREFLTWIRSSTRQAWANSPMKRHMEEKGKYQIENTNPKSMKRFPKVWKRKCAICGEENSPINMELDHIVGENSLRKPEDISNFIFSTLGVFPSELQWLCIDKFKIVNKKKVLIRHGCHELKTYAERYKISFEEAVIHKQAIDIIKTKQDKTFFIDRELDVPSNVEKRKEKIIKILLEELNNNVIQ